MSLRQRISQHFVMPAGDPPTAVHGDFVPPDEGPDRACAEPAPRTPPGVAVLAAPADALPLGAALGLALAGRRRAPVVAVCLWTTAAGGATGLRAPATLAARRLAASLAARGLDVRATGRLAIVQLAQAPDEAAGQARRALAAAGFAPAVLALGGPRAAAFDDLLGEQDLVVVATSGTTDPALARLAVAGLASAAVRACVCEMAPAQPARCLAGAGLTLLPSARRALAGAVEALP